MIVRGEFGLGDQAVAYAIAPYGSGLMLAALVFPQLKEMSPAPKYPVDQALLGKIARPRCEPRQTRLITRATH